MKILDVPLTCTISSKPKTLKHSWDVLIHEAWARIWGCTFGGVYVPCISSHASWSFPNERGFEDVTLEEFMYPVFTRMPVGVSLMSEDLRM